MQRSWLGAIVLALCAPVAAGAGFTGYSQQGGKLVGTSAVGNAYQGWAVAISADGSTAISGAPWDSSDVGAAWVFTRASNVWTQQAKLVPSDAGVDSYFGDAVAISADGNTALVGGSGDSGNTGAVWVFTRSGETWEQQGAKLVGSGAEGASMQGGFIALSGDGNTAAVGGWGDNGSIGAAWVFTRTEGVWTQQGDKLVGTGAVGSAFQSRVALSYDGNTLFVGGPQDDGVNGATWVFVRSSGIWSQAGEKLVATGAVGHANQGGYVALSADGSTALIGAPFDDSHKGAAFVFTRTGNAFTQQAKLVGTGSVSSPVHQGISASLSGDGNTAVLGAMDDNVDMGAAWMFGRSGGAWRQMGDKLVGTGAVGRPGQGKSVSLSADATTVIVGGNDDNSKAGAAWVFVGGFRGDVNGDHAVNVSDVFHLINSLFAQGPPPASQCQGDVSANGATDVLDVFYLINYLFAMGPIPKPPC